MIWRLTVENLALARGERQLFEGLGFSLGRGEAAALTGANGAGKTSLLRAIAGLLRPEAGRVHFEDAAGGEIEADLARAQGLHLLGHHDGLKSTRTAGEELRFWTRWLGGDAASLAQAIDGLQLDALLQLDVRKLSAGQRRRLALARLIAAPRPLWLLDEPMAPLDIERRALFGGLMQAHLDGGGMILAAVHDALPIPVRELKVGIA
jgi:heme exporter protein A